LSERAARPKERRVRPIPALRVRRRNESPVRRDGDFVLYWMIAARRAHHNFALQHAAARAAELGKPLVVLEALRAGYRWASDRLHRFAIDGMADNERAFADKPALYHPYVEPAPGAGKGLLAGLAARAALVVTDDYPAFFLPHMVAAAAARCPVLMEDVDGNGLYPMRATDRVFTTAASFRRHLQKALPDHLGDRPLADPLARLELPRLAALPGDLAARFPRASAALLAGDPAALAALPIDHSVRVSPIRGGSVAAGKALADFLRHKLDRYVDERNDPDADAQSGLSPYLHWGHLSAHEIFERLIKKVGWTPEKLAPKAHGSREGWWNAGAAADSFLDEIVTWRELGFNMCAHRDDYDKYESLPAFARETLAEHAKDKRDPVYDLATLEAAQTYDEIWNASQRQLVREGRIHNYLRMLWGKKVLEWSRTPEEAVATLLELNNKYALDGRDPNSYSGIFWVFGRYDRAWGPEREIFGKVRYMSSDSTRRKVRMSGYLERYGFST
jgi:deoxyribodipyrimidine photo-lyase